MHTSIGPTPGRDRGKTWGFTWPAMCILAWSTVLMISGQLYGSDSFRCGGNVIRTGDTPGEVIDRCGEPLHKDKGFGEINLDSTRQNVRVERWYYKNSKRSLGRTVLIYRGQVVGIETTGR